MATVTATVMATVMGAGITRALGKLENGEIAYLFLALNGAIGEIVSIILKLVPAHQPQD